MFTSVKRSFTDFQNNAGTYADSIRIILAEWWKDVRGENGFEVRAAAIGYAATSVFLGVLGAILLVYLWRRIKRIGIWSRLVGRISPRPRASVVEFYEQMIRLLAEGGIVRAPHQTPMEFARAVAIPEVVGITDKYNAVRFGKRDLSPGEREEIESWLGTFKAKN